MPCPVADPLYLTAGRRPYLGTGVAVALRRLGAEIAPWAHGGNAANEVGALLVEGLDNALWTRDELEAALHSNAGPDRAVAMGLWCERKLIEQALAWLSRCGVDPDRLDWGHSEVSLRGGSVYWSYYDLLCLGDYGLNRATVQRLLKVFGRRVFIGMSEADLAGQRMLFDYTLSELIDSSLPDDPAARAAKLAEAWASLRECASDWHGASPDDGDHADDFVAPGIGTRDDFEAMAAQYDAALRAERGFVRGAGRVPKRWQTLAAHLEAVFDALQARIKKATGHGFMLECCDEALAPCLSILVSGRTMAEAGPCVEAALEECGGGGYMSNPAAQVFPNQCGIATVAAVLATRYAIQSIREVAGDTQ